MNLTGGSCPGAETIERLASGQDVGADIRDHVSDCASCRARLDAAREDATFVARLRTLSAGELAPEGAPRIPGYRPTSIISTGAQGTVFRAEQESTSRTVAIKTWGAGRGLSVRQRVRAEREAEIAARLRHPNIVTVYESRTLSDGRIAVIMEFIDGVPIDEWKAPGATESERQRALLRVFTTICRAIHHAHLNGVIHRDIKPDNILVTSDGRPVVLDFGIAKAEGIRTTMTGEFAGTPAFASPEQVSGKPDDVDALTDVYSLGVLLYRLLCSAMPYDLEGSIFDIARTITEVAPVPPRMRIASLSMDLDAIVMRAMQKDKARRYQSAAGLARDIERYLSGEPVEARGGSGWYLLRKAVLLNKKRLAWAGAAIMVLTIATGAVIVSASRAAVSARRADFEREQAHQENVRARAVTELLREALPNTDPDRPELALAVGSGLNRLFLRLETREFADDPELDQALRRLWGSLYTELGSGKAMSAVEYAEVSLRNGLMKLRQAHRGDHPEVAATLHELAGVLVVRRRAPEAEVACRSALEMRERLGEDYAVATARSRALLAKILLACGRPDDAMREADLALAAFGSEPERSANLAIGGMCALKGRVMMDRGDYESAEELVREGLRRRVQALPANDPEFLSSLGDASELAFAHPRSRFAAELQGAWGLEGAELRSQLQEDILTLARHEPFEVVDPNVSRTAALQRLYKLQVSLVGNDDPSIIGTLISLMRATWLERFFSAHADVALQLSEILSERFGPNDLSVLTCLERASNFYSVEGDAARAAEIQYRVCAIWDSIEESARDQLFAANSRRLLAWFLAIDGRHEESIVENTRALDALKKCVGEAHHLYALTESCLAYALAETGRLDEAEIRSRRAFELAQRSTAIAADQFAHVCFARGHVLFKSERYVEAQAAHQLSWDRYYRLGFDAFRPFRTLVDEMAVMHEIRGDAAGAEEWRSRVGLRSL